MPPTTSVGTLATVALERGFSIASRLRTVAEAWSSKAVAAADRRDPTCTAGPSLAERFTRIGSAGEARAGVQATNGRPHGRRASQHVGDGSPEVHRDGEQMGWRALLAVGQVGVVEPLGP